MIMISINLEHPEDPALLPVRRAALMLPNQPEYRFALPLPARYHAGEEAPLESKGWFAAHICADARATAGK